MESYKLGSVGYVNMRMASTPRTRAVGAIESSDQIEIAERGNWAIRSGSYRAHAEPREYFFSGNVTRSQSTYRALRPIGGVCDDMTGSLVLVGHLTRQAPARSAAAV